MGEHTGIGWTHHTFNGWIGCTEVSPGCANCYARALAETRLGVAWGKDAPRPTTAPSTWLQPLRWNRAAARAGVREMCFVESLGDVLEDRRDLDEPRRWLFAMMEHCTSIDWQLVTKRPERASELLPPDWIRLGAPPNVWFGVTVENQASADWRLPLLMAVRSMLTPRADGDGPNGRRRGVPPITFVSYEPALERVLLGPWLQRVDQVIAGGESLQRAARARVCDVEWIRTTIRDCRASLSIAACFVKQLGSRGMPDEYPRGARGARVLEGRWVKHRSGADPSEWPEDVRVQQFPFRSGYAELRHAA